MTEDITLEMINDIRAGYIDVWDDLTIDELFKTIEKEHAEIQQYRTIGTIEELEAMKKSTLSAMELVDIWCVLEDLKKYSAIGTVEEFKALKEKNEPKFPLSPMLEKSEGE